MAKKRISNRIINTFQEVMDSVITDLGRTITIYVRNGHNPDIPWDTVRDEPLDTSTSPDQDDWYIYDVYSIQKASIIWDIQRSSFYSIGRFDPQGCEVTCLLSDVLIDKTDINGETLFDTMEYCMIDGNKMVKDSVVAKSGLRDLYLCTVHMTARVE
jgi:hypothetical protein